MSVVEVEDDGIHRRLFPVELAFDFSRADHSVVFLLRTSRPCRH
jgi:hypothetical protein